MNQRTSSHPGGHRFASASPSIAVAIAVALSWPPAALAEAPASAAASISLPDALARALEHNRDLAAFEHRLAEQSARVEQIALRGNPTLRLEVEGFAGSGEFESFDRAQTTLSLEWVLERTLRRRRVAAAEERSSLVLRDAERLRLEVAGETAERFLSTLANQSRLEVAGEGVSLAEATVTAVKRRVESGRAPTAELIRAEAELADARLVRDDVDHELEIARHLLAAQWGERSPRFATVRGDLLRLPKPAPFEEFEQRLEQNPSIARLHSEERAARAERKLAEARAWPTLRPRLGVRHINESDDFAAVAEISVPFPLFDRNQGRIQEADSAIERTRAERDAARVRVRMALFTAYVELEHNIHRVQTLRNEILPRLVRAFEEIQRGYERGRYSYLDWRSVQVELLEARGQLIEASAGAHRLVIVLERLTGEPVIES